MKVTYNWLKDFVQIKISPAQLADQLTLAGLEVTGLAEKDKDAVFEMEITSNRPDCLSVIGIAREVAAITRQKLKTPVPLAPKPTTKARGKHCADSQEWFAIKIEDKKDCPLYTAKIIKGVKVGPSPHWLKERLALVGCRSVNNLVDITNYILFTWGEPLHAFDLDKLVLGFSGSRVLPLEIIIRRAKKAEEIITIDNIRRVLDENILVIASQVGGPKNSRTCELTNKPIAIAGVMGGRDTEVVDDTQAVLLEAAIFNPIVIRRQRQLLGIQSESSYRFERGIDSEIIEAASQQAVNLIQELTGGRCVLAKDSGLPKKKKPMMILNTPSVNKILGAKIGSSQIKSILGSLGFSVKAKGKNNLSIIVPAHRQDIHLAMDLIEEVARIYGYTQIPQTLPWTQPQVKMQAASEQVALIKNLLVGLGLNEVVTYSLIDPTLWKDANINPDTSSIEILNPLSKEQGILRPSLVLSLTHCVADNLNQQEDDVNIFEVAKVFSAAQGQPQEELFLGLALCGIKSRFVPELGLVKEKSGLLHLKGILEILFARLGIKNYRFAATDNLSTLSICIDQEKIGRMQILGENARRALDIKNKEVWVAELSLEKLIPQINLKKHFTSLPAYPGISRDISFIVKHEIPVAKIITAIKEKAQPLIQEVKIVDYYQGRQIPAGFKGFTISCLYRAPDRTLTEAEINPWHTGVIDLLVDKFAVKIR